MTAIPESKELKKASGDIFFEARRMPDNAFIHVNWIGIQSLETIVMGGNCILSMLRERPCKALLNSNKELIGPWDMGVNWIANKWAPQASALGLRYFAHVLSPGIYGQRSYQSAHPLLQKQFDIRSFDDEEGAKEWLWIKSD